MRIAIFSESFLPKWDGVANTVCHLLDHLAARGHSSLMFAPEGASERYAETHIVGLSSFSFPLYPDLKLVPPLVNVKQQLAAFHPDIVHLVNPASLGLVGTRTARELNLPTVASYHTDIPGYTTLYGLDLLKEPVWNYFRWLHNQADLNYCPSTFTRDELVAHGFKRVKVWPHGVDTVRFNPSWRDQAWRMRLTDGHPDAPLLLYVGRLAVEKRVDWLRPLLDVVPGARLALVGDGPMRPALEAQFAGTPTVFTGYLKGEDLSRAYAAADIFVFPSANETFGNVVLEAMASGLPAIAPRSGGPVDQVTSGENGYLFAPDDQDAMFAAVRRCVYDRAHTLQLGMAARMFAESQSWETILDDLLEDYQALADMHKARFQQPTSPALIAHFKTQWQRATNFDFFN